MTRLQTHLDTYSQASNAKVNFHKTEALSLSGSRITPSSIWYGPLLSHRISRWHDCHSVNPVIYLGYPLYTFTAQRDSYLAALLRKINTACVLHSHRSLSVRGRATIINSLILSKLCHVLRVTSVPRAFLEKSEVGRRCFSDETYVSLYKYGHFVFTADSGRFGSSRSCYSTKCLTIAMDSSVTFSVPTHYLF